MVSGDLQVGLLGLDIVARLSTLLCCLQLLWSALAGLRLYCSAFAVFRSWFTVNVFLCLSALHSFLRVLFSDFVGVMLHDWLFSPHSWFAYLGLSAIPQSTSVHRCGIDFLLSFLCLLDLDSRLGAFL